MKVSLKGFTKRLACFLSAFMIVFYTLVSSPCFGVHAISSDSFLDAAQSFLLSAGKAAYSFITGGNPVAGFIGDVVFGLADQNMNYIKASDASHISTETNLSTTSGFACSASIDSIDYTVKCFTLNPTTFTYNKLGLNSVYGTDMYFPVFSATNGDGYSLMYSLCFIPLDDADNRYDWTDGDYVSVSSTFRANKYGNDLDHYFRIFDSSGSPVIRYFRFDIRITSRSPDASSRVVSSSTFGNSSHHFKIFSNSNAYKPYTSESFENFLKTGRYDFVVGSGGLAAGSGASYSFPTSEEYNSITYENVYDYLNVISYPYICNNYPVWEIQQPPSYYIPDEVEPTEPTTGDGTIIIIDPFTLPPEWVESDVVELDTQSYTIDYDTYIDAPVDELNVPLSPDNPLHGGSNILAYGIKFLKDGGIFYILLPLLLIGIFIRFLGI